MEITSSLFVAIVGTGKVASALHRSLGANHSAIFNSRSFEEAFVSSIPNCSAIVLAVSDDAIAPVVENLVNVIGISIKKIPIIHCSGAFSSSVFEKQGLIGATMHPAIRIGADTNFQDVLFAVEGSEQAKKIIDDIFTLIGGKSFQISTEDKAKYHLASVIASNFTSMLLNQSYNLFQECNISSQSAKALTEQLLHSSLPIAFSKDFSSLCTGPAARRDSGTMNLHKSLIDGDQTFLECYESLSKLIQEKVT
jgi:predicted short-subunit dehydrogenase-like oxidoreductase (DUF2520 family)